MSKRPGARVSFELCMQYAPLLYRALGASERAAVKAMIAGRRARYSDAPHSSISHVANQRCRACRAEAIAVVILDYLRRGEKA